MSGEPLDDTMAYPVWSWQLDELLGLTVVEVARLQGFAYRRKNERGWEPDARVQRFIAELWERCCGG